MLLVGCASTVIRQDNIIDLSGEGLKIIRVDGVKSVVKYPDKKIKIDFTEPVKFGVGDVVRIVSSSKGNNFVGVERETGSSTSVSAGRFMVFGGYEGSVAGFMESIQEGLGVWIVEVRDGYLLTERKMISIPVFHSYQAEYLDKVLTTFGIKGLYDKAAGQYSVECDFYQWKGLSGVLSRELSIVELSIAIVEKNINQNSRIGIDWSQFLASLTNDSSVASVLSVKALTSTDFGLSASRGIFSLAGVVAFGEGKKIFKSTEFVRVSLLVGEDGRIDVSTKIPYVSSVALATIGTGTNTAPVQSTAFDVVDSGIVIDLNVVVRGDSVFMRYNLKRQSVPSYVQVGTQGNLIQRPIVDAKNIKGMVMFPAGGVILLSSYRYHTSQESVQGLYGLRSSVREETDIEIEVGILASGRITKYIYTGL
jgi:hypothetical protein